MSCGCQRRAVKPRTMVLGNHHALGEPIRRRVDGGGRGFQALTIGRQSDVDAIIVIVNGREYTVDLSSPLVLPIEETVLEFKPFYGQGDEDTYKALIAVDLWPELPAVWPVARGPKRIDDDGLENAPSISTSEADIFNLPTYGRSAARVWMTEAAGGPLSVRIEGHNVIDGSTVRKVPLWPDPDDSTALKTIAAGTTRAVINVEGVQYLNIRALATSAGSMNVWWKAED